MKAREPAARPLVEKAPPGVHHAAFAVLQRFAPPGARIIDLGAGTGAWSHRLKAAGYSVIPVDREAGQWALDAVPLTERDLNREFADGLGGPFDVITSLEVIEHLENPSLFLRECRRLVSEAGFILLTTPNIENVAGRLRFMLTGHLRGFDRDERWNEPTHITPIQTYLFEKLCRQAHLEEVWHGHSSPAETTRGRAKRLVLASLRPLLTGARGGEHHIYVLRRQGK